MEKYISKKILREFGVLVGIGFPALAGFLIPALWGHNFKFWTLFVCLPFLFLASFKPSLLNYPYQLWMKLGYILGWINSRIILGLVFLLVLQPIAFGMKCFGYDPLRIKKTNKNTFRERRSILEIDLKKIF